MKNLITLVVVMFVASSAYAADEKSGAMQGDMMKNCQHYMKDGKMMDSMPKDMMGQCQEMMKNNGMMKDGMKSDAAKSEAPKVDDNADHTKHHPAP